MKMLRNYGLLTLKPLLIVLNVGDDPAGTGHRAHLCDYHHRSTPSCDACRAGWRWSWRRCRRRKPPSSWRSYGIAGAGAEPRDPPELHLLGLHSFFTVGEDEVRAWTIPVGAPAVEAAGVIHTDLARGFIRAEVIAYDDLMRPAACPPPARRVCCGWKARNMSSRTATSSTSASTCSKAPTGRRSDVIWAAPLDVPAITTASQPIASLATSA